MHKKTNHFLSTFLFMTPLICIKNSSHINILFNVEKLMPNQITPLCNYILS